MLRCLSLCLLISATLVASGAEFEVASVRPAAADAPAGIGVHIDRSQVRLGRVTLKELLGIAYRLPPQRIVGPDWLGEPRFDIVAKIPGGVPATQVPDMLQALLASRFQMKSHRESKEFSVYALVAGKDGFKGQPAATDPAAERPRSFDVNAGGSPAGAGGDLGNGASFALQNNRLEVRHLTMEGMASLLTRLSDRPVLDATGISGAYDLALDIAPEDFTPIMIRAAVNNGTTLPPAALRMLDSASLDPFSNGLHKAGLGLDSRRAQLETLVIDSIQKTPTEN